MDWDIVYFVKDAKENEELRYSLRSLKNFPHRKVWFYGGRPDWARPDEHVRILQNKGSKYDNVHHMISVACHNSQISSQFFLFNDDFFIMRPTEYHPYYRGGLHKYIVDIENRANCISAYTRRLRNMVRVLEEAGLPTLNYEMHVPLLIDRAKMLEVLARFAGLNGVRSLYGNYAKLGGEKMDDVKVFSPAQRIPASPLLSTSDETFLYGEVGRYIREHFPLPSQYEAY